MAAAASNLILWRQAFGQYSGVDLPEDWKYFSKSDGHYIEL